MFCVFDVLVFYWNICIVFCLFDLFRYFKVFNILLDYVLLRFVIKVWILLDYIVE